MCERAYLPYKYSIISPWALWGPWKQSFHFMAFMNRKHLFVFNRIAIGCYLVTSCRYCIDFVLDNDLDNYTEHGIHTTVWNNDDSNRGRIWTQWSITCVRQPSTTKNKDKSFLITQTQDIFSQADAAWKHPNYPCFWILPLEFEVNIDMHKHENSEVIYSNRNKAPKKCLGTPDCTNMENISIDFIWQNTQAKYLRQTISYYFKWVMALWKWPKCPQYMPRFWWQTVATQHMGLT